MSALQALLGAANASALNPALALLPPKLDSREARLLVLAICLQESGLTARAQRVAGGGKGPARGLAQFELTGVRGVMTHPASRELVAKVCTDRRIGGATSSVVWAELENDDVLAMALARLLLLTDPRPLPPEGDEEGAWAYYLRNWRPGKPHRDRWGPNYQAALAFVR